MTRGRLYIQHLGLEGVERNDQKRSFSLKRRIAGTHRTKGEKESKSETKSVKPQNTNALSVLSPLEEVCLKLQPLTMAVCLCWCPHTKATVGFLKGWHQGLRLPERERTLQLLGWPADGHTRLKHVHT